MEYTGGGMSFDRQIKSAYIIDAFEEEYIGTNLPSQTWRADSIEEVAKMLYNCSRDISGIKQLKIWIMEIRDEKANSEPL